ncbi:MAG: DUF4215 domain-containing protein [Deltaproteobacteria bacterium]|nr:DUF4215 domain-containing protein [Deltaproteobacteria bacterium]
MTLHLRLFLAPAAVGLAGMLAVGCGDECERSSDCPDGYYCFQGSCRPFDPDAGADADDGLVPDDGIGPEGDEWVGPDGDADPDIDVDGYIPYCGNGIRDDGEECDDGNFEDIDDCTTACVAARCGDSIIRLHPEAPADLEQCDDGNAVSGDGCEPDCTFSGNCGDGAVAPPEECDDANFVWTDDCVNCANARCGDGYVRLTAANPADIEVCDDGNATAGDGCEADCRYSPLCGNGTVDPPEVCDDGDFEVTDDCIACQAARCGDGLLRTNPANPADLEQCDDGNAISGDGCDADCTYTCVADDECPDLDPCLFEFCDPSFHVCASIPEYDGIECGGDICSGFGTCLAGACYFSGPLDCNDHEACTTDGCDPLTGCHHTEAAEGSVCDDGLFCISNDRCRRGLDGILYCTGELGTSPCNDGDPCTTDRCIEASDTCEHGFPEYLALVCGDEMMGNAMGRPSEYSAVSCPGGTQPAAGADVVMQIEVVRSGTLSVTLNAAETGSGTVVMILSDPCSVTCLAASTTTAAVTVTPGTYYVLLDSPLPGSAYAFTPTCP